MSERPLKGKPAERCASSLRKRGLITQSKLDKQQLQPYIQHIAEYVVPTSKHLLSAQGA